MENMMNLYDNLNWEKYDDYFEGTLRKVLRDENGAKTILLKLPAGFYMTPHSHITVEQHFVLDGEYESRGKIYKKGAYQIFAKGDEQGPYKSDQGALILVIWDPIY